MPAERLEPEAVLLDAMVLVAGLTSRKEPSSFSKRLLEAAFDGDVNLVLTETLLDEARAVLIDEGFAGRVDKDVADALLEGLRSVATLVLDDRGAVRRRWCADPDDDYLVEAALFSKAMLVTRDDRADFASVPGLDCGRPGTALRRAGLLTS